MTPNRDGKEDEKVEFSTCPGQKRRSCGVHGGYCQQPMSLEELKEEQTRLPSNLRQTTRELVR